jgi:hypothetical protein
MGSLSKNINSNLQEEEEEEQQGQLFFDQLSVEEQDNLEELMYAGDNYPLGELPSYQEGAGVGALPSHPLEGSSSSSSNNNSNVFDGITDEELLNHDMNDNNNNSNSSSQAEQPEGSPPEVRYEIYWKDISQGENAKEERVAPLLHFESPTDAAQWIHKHGKEPINDPEKPHGYTIVCNILTPVSQQFVEGLLSKSRQQGSSETAVPGA